jgi:hypothetical protein
MGKKDLALALETVFELGQENKLDKDDPELEHESHLKKMAKEQDEDFGVVLEFISGLKSGKFYVTEVYPATSSGVQIKES